MEMPSRADRPPSRKVRWYDIFSQKTTLARATSNLLNSFVIVQFRLLGSFVELIVRINIDLTVSIIYITSISRVSSIVKKLR